MTRGKIDNYEWMKKYLTEITEIAKEISDSGPTNDYGCYSALKLICVYYYSQAFLKVAKHPDRKRESFDGAVYIDLFAGSGMVKLTDTGDLVAGSTICAVSKSHFDYTVCVEMNSDRKEALEKRLGKLLPPNNFDVIEGNCNERINDVVSLIKNKFRKPIVLTFVDPEGMEIKWSTLEALSNEFLSLDFMINVNSSGATRVKGKLDKGDYSVRKTLEEYWGEDARAVLTDLAEGKKPEQKYQERINKILGKNVGVNIPIHDQGKKIAYYILGYTRMTSGGSGYANAFVELEKRIKRADRDVVRNILDQIHDRSKSLG